MKLFAALVETLDQTTKTNTKVAALKNYFLKAPKQDALWTIASFQTPSRPITTTQMRAWAAREAKVPDWLFEETYHIVGIWRKLLLLYTPPIQRQNSIGR